MSKIEGQGAGVEWRSRVHGISLTVCALVVGPLLGVFVDIVYVLLLMLMLDRLRLTPTRAVMIMIAVSAGILVFATSPFASSPYFSYFFLRIPLLLLVFLSIRGGEPKPDPKWLWSLFVVYVAAIVYQYFALPGSEWLTSLHADKIVDADLAYRASGLFSGYFSAATVIGSLGVILILRSGVTGTVAATLLILVVAFCSGRSVIIYLMVAMAVKAVMSPRVAITSVSVLFAAVLLGIISAGDIFSANAELHESAILFSQISGILSGDVTGTSTEALINEQYYLPDDLKTMLLGNNERPFTQLGVKSDSGYVQLIFGVGLIGTLVYLALLVWIFFWRHNLVVLTLFAAALLVSFKGNVFNAIGVLDIILLCCADPRIVVPSACLPSQCEQGIALGGGR